MTNLDDLFALLEEMKAEELAAKYAFHMAIGQWTDRDDPADLANSECVAVVLEGKLWSLSLADSYARERDKELVSFTVNAVIMNAFRIWKLDYERLLTAAKQRLDTDPQARQQLRYELERNSRN